MTVIHENISFQQSNGEWINLKTIQQMLQQESSVSIIGFDEQFQLQKVYISSVQKIDPQRPMLTIKTKKKRILHLELTARPVIFNTKKMIGVAATELHVGDQLLLPLFCGLDFPDQKIAALQYVQDCYVLIDEQFIHAAQQAYKRGKNLYGSRLALLENIGGTAINKWWGNNPCAPMVKRVLRLSSQTGTRIPITRVRMKSSKPGNSFLLPWKVNALVAELLGLWEADGSFNRDGVHLWNKDLQIHDRWRYLVKSVFDINPTLREKEPGYWQSTCYNNALKLFMSRMCGVEDHQSEKAHFVHVPAEIMQSSNSSLMHFINGYFAGDGSADDSTARISSASQRMIQDLAYCFWRLGIFVTVDELVNEDGNLKHRVTISGLQVKKYVELLRAANGFVYERTKLLYDYVDKQAGNHKLSNSVRLSREFFNKILNTHRFMSVSSKKDRMKKDIMNIRSDTRHGGRGLTIKSLSTIIEELRKNQGDKLLVDELHDILSLLKIFYVDNVTEVTMIQPESGFKIEFKNSVSYVIAGYPPMLVPV